jgi:GTP:adenosylcobinamide-phosphate guanylyltransferase
MRPGARVTGEPHPTLPLSVSIVCFNNQTTIRRTLESVADIASEIVAVDSGSTDATLELLQSAGARVIHQPWLGHIRQKQLALESCTHPWILHLDSDESLEPDLRASIADVIRRNNPSIGACAMIRKVWYAGRFLNHTWQPEWRTRLVRSGLAAWGGYDPHDALELTPEARTRVQRIPGVMRHDSISTIAEFMAKQASHARIAAASYQRMGRHGSVSKLLTSPAGTLFKQLVLKCAWRDGWRGWVAAGAAACGAFMKHAILLERSMLSHEPTSEVHDA